MFRKAQQKSQRNAAKYALGTLLGSVTGGVLGNKAGDYWSKEEKEELKNLTVQFMARLKRQPRLYSLYVQIEQLVKASTVMKNEQEKKKTRKTALKLTQTFLNGLTEHDKVLYLKIQKLTDDVYSIQSNSISIGVTLGGVIGLVLAGNIK